MSPELRLALEPLAKTGYEQAMLSADRLPEDDMAWEAQSTKLRTTWLDIALAILQQAQHTNITIDSPRDNVR